MNLPAFLKTPGVRAKLATLLFLISLVFGNIALIGGFEDEGGIPAACVFAIVCVLWWISYRMSCSANRRGMTLGFVALGLWILNLAGALVSDFHHYVVDHFFWVTTAVLLALVVAIALSEAASDGPRASQSLT